MFFSLMVMLKLLTINSAIQMSFDQYPRYANVTQYLISLRRTFPSQVNLYNIGRSLEGRAILAIKISCQSCIGKTRKPAILIDAGIHGREWMAPLTALYIINELVTNSKNVDMLKNVDWYIIPLLNPDGYEYSFVKERFWRKNRREGDFCDGIDINRNFGYHWNGTDANPCSEIYEGQKSDSEPETKALQKLTLKLSGQVKLYLTFHTYGPYMLFPWASIAQPIANYKEHKTLGDNVAKVIEKFRGTKYKVGTVGEMMYMASGSSLDWMAGVAKVPLGYAIELPESTKVFDPPLLERLNISIETLQGIKVFHKYVEYKWWFKKYK